MKNEDIFKNFEEEIIKLGMTQNEKKEIDFDHIEIDKEIEDLNQDFIDDLAIYINLLNKFKLIESPSFQLNKALTSLKNFLSFKKQIIRLKKEKEINLNINDSLEKKSLENKSSSIQKINDNSKETKNKINVSKNEKSNKSSCFNDINLNKSQYKKYNLTKSSTDEKKNKSVNNIPILNQPKKSNKTITNETNKDIMNANINGYLFEQNSIDFMKNSLFAIFCNYEIFIPGIIQINKLYEKLKNTNLKEIFIKPYKDSIKFDMTISGFQKKEIMNLIKLFNKNIFLPECLNLNENGDEETFDLLFEIASNIHKQSQDKYYQINTYSILIKILNELRKKDPIDDNIKNEEKEELNNRLCKILKISNNNEKILFLITDGSYLVLSQLIKHYKLNQIKNISIKENEGIQKIFNKYKNHRNAKNTEKLFEILSMLTNNKIKFCIVYISDEVGDLIDKEYINKIKFVLKCYEKKNITNQTLNFNNFKNSISNEENQMFNYIQFKENIDVFLNLLITKELNLNKEIKLYSENYINNNTYNDLLQNLMEQLSSDVLNNFFKQFKICILIPKEKKDDLNNKDDIKNIEKIATINFSEKTLNEIFYENNNEYTKLFNYYINNLNPIIKDDQNVKLYHYNKEEFFNTKNIIQKIEYDLIKIFNIKYNLKVDEKELNLLKYDNNNNLDKNFLGNIEKLCNEIINMYFIKNILKKNNEFNNKQNILLLIENLKCFNFYYCFIKNFIQKINDKIQEFSLKIIKMSY